MQGMSAIQDQAAAPCPCGSRVRYAACCGRYHAGESGRRTHPEGLDALALQRVRARSAGLSARHLAPVHPSGQHRAAGARSALAGLADQGGAVARAMPSSSPAASWAVAPTACGMKWSRFVREAGRWWYLDGRLSRALISGVAQAERRHHPVGGGAPAAQALGRGALFASAVELRDGIADLADALRLLAGRADLAAIGHAAHDDVFAWSCRPRHPVAPPEPFLDAGVSGS